MSLVKINTRRMADLVTPTDLGENLLKFKDVIVPCGAMPAGYEFVEGVTLEQIAKVIVAKLDMDTLIPDCDCSGNGSGDGGGETPTVTATFALVEIDTGSAPESLTIDAIINGQTHSGLVVPAASPMGGNTGHFDDVPVIFNYDDEFLELRISSISPVVLNNIQISVQGFKIKKASDPDYSGSTVTITGTTIDNTGTFNVLESVGAETTTDTVILKGSYVLDTTVTNRMALIGIDSYLESGTTGLIHGAFGSGSSIVNTMAEVVDYLYNQSNGSRPPVAEYCNFDFSVNGNGDLVVRNLNNFYATFNTARIEGADYSQIIAPESPANSSGRVSFRGLNLRLAPYQG